MGINKNCESAMTISRRVAACLITVGAAFLMSACVSTRVTSQAIGASAPPAKQLLIIVKSGKFSANNTASHLGQRNFDNLVPHLVSRLPVVFSQNGVPSRAIDAYVSDLELQRSLKPAPGERVLIVSPQSATYNTKSGQELFLRVELLSDPPMLAPVWQAQVRMGTLGFGQFDAKVANDIALQILEQIRGDKMAAVVNGVLRVE
jgi:hypothetical protein